MRQITKAGTAVAGLALLLSACSSGSSGTTTPAESSAPASTAPAASGELLIWADDSANVAKTVEPLCQSWAEANGVTCKVKKFSALGDIRDQVIKANKSGDVPDLFIGPHDWLGELNKNGVVAPIDLAANAANFSTAAVAASNYGGQNYGVPWAVENVAMLVNKDLAPECPASLDAAAQLGKDLIASKKATLGIALQIGETGDAYHWYPLYSADGGYIFGTNPDGSLNPEDLGVGKDGSIAAAERLQQLADDGVIKASVTYDIARETFAKGKAPYFITGSWQIPEQSKALGDSLMVCPVPNWEGSTFTSSPFVGVQMFFQTQKAPNPVLASTFLNDEVMTTAFMDAMFAGDPRPPAWLESYATAAAADPNIKAFGDYGATGTPLPAIPEMASVWGDLGLAEFKVASGEDPEKTMVAAGDSITKAIASQG
jgi:arabinogalactan oligomer / maltooligosaccharide transport system substrate-binding protein